MPAFMDAIVAFFVGLFSADDIEWR